MGHVYFRNASVRQGLTDLYNVHPPIFLQEEKEEERLILASSLCDLNDSSPADNEARFTRFIVQASSINKGDLEGRLFMLWDKKRDPSESSLDKLIVTKLSSLEILANQLRFEWAVESEPLSLTLAREQTRNKDLPRIFEDFKGQLKELDGTLDSIEKGLPETGEYFASCIKFTVTNSGFCYLKHNQSDAIEKEIDVSKETQIAYYFLKYLLHNHSHHNENLDSFCRAHRIQIDEHEKSDARLILAKKLIRDVKSNLIEIKQQRNGLKAFTRNAFGCAAYGKALVYQLQGDGILDGEQKNNDFVNRQIAYIDSFSKSLEIKQEEKSATCMGEKSLLTSKIVAFILMLFSPLLIYGLRVSPTTRVNENFDWLTKSIIEISSNGILQLFSIYITIVVISWLIASWYLSYKEKGIFRGYLLDTLSIKKAISGLFRPEKVTATASAKLFARFRCKVGYFWLNTIDPKVNIDRYWDHYSNSRLNVILRMLLWLAILISIILIGLWVYFVLISSLGISKESGLDIFIKMMWV